MGYKLFLDDIREPIHCYEHMIRPIYKEKDWVVVRSYDEFVEHITKNGLPDLISFDHDLGNDHYQHTSGEIPYDTFEEKTGYHCAKWLVDYCQDNELTLPEFMIHSMNPVGGRNIISVLVNYLIHIKEQN